MDMPDYTLAQVKAAIEPGRPETLTTAGAAFTAAAQALTELSATVSTQVAAFTSGEAAWIGPASAGFIRYTAAFTASVDALAGAVSPYATAVTTAGDALRTAQADLAAHEATVPAGETDADPVASQILATLAAAYTTAVSDLAAAPGEEDLGLDPGAEADADPDLSADPTLEDDLPTPDEPGLFDTSGLLADLVSVDLGGGPQLQLGSIDPTSLLAGFEGPPGPSPLLNIPPGGSGPSGLPGSPAPFVPQTALTGDGRIGPLGGLSPATHLTTAGPPPAAPGSTPGGGGGRSPFMPLGGLGGPMGGGLVPGRSQRGRAFGVLGRPGDDEEEETQSRAAAVDAEEWTDGAGLTDAIGRDSTTRRTGA